MSIWCHIQHNLRAGPASGGVGMEKRQTQTDTPTKSRGQTAWTLTVAPWKLREFITLSSAKRRCYRLWGGSFDHGALKLKLTLQESSLLAINIQGGEKAIYGGHFPHTQSTSIQGPEEASPQETPLLLLHGSEALVSVCMSTHIHSFGKYKMAP